MKVDAWSLLMQAINVGVLLWLLQRFLYRPLRRVIAQRQQAVTQALTDARAARARADAAAVAIESQRAELAITRRQAFDEAIQRAEAQREELLRQTEAELASRRANLQSALEREHQELASRVHSEAAELAVRIARQLLQRLPAATLLDAFLDGVCAELRQLPEAGGLLAGSPLDCVSAQPLDASEQQRVRERLSAALGMTPLIRFQVDSSLLAGFELHLPHAQVRNHWRRDLDRVLEALRGDAAAI